jgi:hypothetical protein
MFSFSAQFHCGFLRSLPTARRTRGHLQHDRGFDTTWFEAVRSTMVTKGLIWISRNGTDLFMRPFRLRINALMFRGSTE